jgi:hypothetical protein
MFYPSYVGISPTDSWLCALLYGQPLDDLFLYFVVSGKTRPYSVNEQNLEDLEEASRRPEYGHPFSKSRKYANTIIGVNTIHYSILHPNNKKSCDSIEMHLA